MIPCDSELFVIRSTDYLYVDYLYKDVFIPNSLEDKGSVSLQNESWACLLMNIKSRVP